MRTAWIFVAASALAAALPLAAHHSFAAEHDAEKPVTVKGIVSKVAWVNPHAYLYVTMKGAGGKETTYAFETSSPNALMRRGWKRTTLKEGDAVTIEGYLAKDTRPLPDGSIHANARQVTLGDGKTVFAGSASGETAPAK